MLRNSNIPVSKDLAVQIISLTIIFLIAFLIRLYPSPIEKVRAGLGQFGDTNLYHQIAYNLCTGKGFSGVDDGSAYGQPKRPDVVYEPAVTRAPGYPFFMCVIYRLFGLSDDNGATATWHLYWNQVRNVQAFLDASLCLTIFFMVRMIAKTGYRAALIASLLYCFSAYNIYYTKALLSEALATFLITWVIFFFISGLRQRSLRGWFGAGITLGMTILTRPEYMLFVPVLIILIYLIRPGIEPVLRHRAAAIFLFCSISVVLPWTARNYLLFHKIIPVSTGGLGYNLYLGTFESNDNWNGWGKFPENIFIDEVDKKRTIALSESFSLLFKQGSIRVNSIDREFMRLAINRIIAQPWQVVKLWFQRLPRLWYQFYVQMYGDREATGLYFIFYFVFVVFAIVSADHYERAVMIPIVALFFYLNLVFLPLHVEPRYGVGAMPAMISLAGIGIRKTFVMLFGRRAT